MLTLYEAIYRRKSIHKFRQAPLEPARAQEILAYAQGIQPPGPAGELAFQLVSREETGRMFRGGAPQYLAVYARESPYAHIQAGYALQHVDLWLSAQGLGACWLGMAAPTKGARLQMDGMDYVVMLALGEPDEPLHRENKSEFIRKPMEEITDQDFLGEPFEALRMAPSAVNGQPWFITKEEEQYILYRKKTNAVKAGIFASLNRIDCGIALCHLDVAAKAQGMDIAIQLLPETTTPSGLILQAAATIDKA